MLEHPVQLRWADLDPLNHVNNVRLMEYLQEARLALLAQLDLVPKGGDHLDADYGQVVARNEVDYLRPLFLTQEPVVVRTWVERIGTSSYTLCHEVVAPDGGVAARASTVLVVTDSAVSGSRPIPAPLRDALTAHLRG